MEGYKAPCYPQQHEKSLPFHGDHDQALMGRGVIMNHKRKGPKSTRAGCLWCKPHKHQRAKDSQNGLLRQERRARLSEAEWRASSGSSRPPVPSDSPPSAR
jgi:hypothetical protein